jgi:hypothetical protein
MRNAYSAIDGNPDGKKQLERSAHVWRENIVRQVEVTGCEDVDWIQLAEGRALMNSPVPQRDQLSNWMSGHVECKLM